MTQQEKFNQTVGILVRAYLNDELEHKVCSACAVGNIIAFHMGTKPGKLSVPVECVVAGDKYVILRYDNNHFENGEYAMSWYTKMEGCASPDGARQIKSTGYSVGEIYAIEKSFESAPMGKSTDEWMFNGLMAVVDVLAKIHGINLEQSESAKLLFVKP